jgi:hypothetical protein
VARAPKEPFPRRKHRKHENGVFTFGRARRGAHEGWQPSPTPAEAHARFAELRNHWQSHFISRDFTAQLIVRGDVADEIVVRAKAP